MVQRPRPDLRGGVRSNAHSYRNRGEGLGNDPSYPAQKPIAYRPNRIVTDNGNRSAVP